MTLDEILKILDREEATRVAECGRNASWHWYKDDHRRKVPGMPILVAWADHLELSDADLGELIRDAQQVRIQILEQLAQTDKRRIASRSILRKELAKEIAQELQELRNQNSAERARLMREKEEILRRETQEQERQSKRDDRLEQIKLKLKKLRRSNGDY
tara:strand:+ start:4727 stop:5203 length:477 start_codon:yes stop_codon:yes gene_type:complete